MHKRKAVWKYSKKAASMQASKPAGDASPETKPISNLILNFQLPELWEIKLCGLSHSVSGIWDGSLSRLVHHFSGPGSSVSLFPN